MDERDFLSSPDRQLWRTLVRLESVSTVDGQARVYAVIPAWHPHWRVGLEAKLLPEDVWMRLREGTTRVLARVNVGAERAADLEFADFELAPEPDLDAVKGEDA